MEWARIPPAATGAYNPKTGQCERPPTQYDHPQCSACFIQSVEDNMESIMNLATSEAMLFKFGSGTGTDLTPLRSKREKLSGGGRPSGPLSFLQVYDQVAGIVKSGGKTRRAAKMNTIRDWHGDIEEFIDCKSHRGKEGPSLIAQGYDSSFNGEAYGSIKFQNENLSVRVSDEFMQAAIDGKEWWTKAVTTGSHSRRKMLRSFCARLPWAPGHAAIPACNTMARFRSGTPARARKPSIQPTRAPNTCS